MPMMKQIWTKTRPHFFSSLLETYDSGASHKNLSDHTKICRANSIFLPTCSTICRQAPLFADKIHYLPTQASICRHRQLFADTGNYSPTKTSIFCRHVPNAPTFATLRNVSFSLSGPPLPPPPPTFGAPSRSASPAARQRFLPARQPARIQNGT
jgi:hypothetical protein